MCGDSFYTLGSGVASQLDKYGKAFLAEDSVKCLRSHDIVFCNIESVLSDIGMKRSSLRSMHMRGKPQFARYLADWGINVANLANNHILEQGYDAAVGTVAQLEEAGIKTIGAGKDKLFRHGFQVVEFFRPDQIIVFLGICLLDEKYAFNGGLTLQQALEATRKLKKQNKIVVVSIHWGKELMDRPSALQRHCANKFFDAGALLVIGHHPHVVQGIEKVNGGLVAYSLGNFIFNCFRQDTKWSIILSVTLENSVLTQWQCIPIEVGNNHRPRLAEESRREQLGIEIIRRCRLLNSELTDQQYEQEYNNRISVSKQELRLELLRNVFHMNPIFWPQIAYRFLKRRVGKW